MTDKEAALSVSVVPNVIGKTGVAANQMLINAGLNVEISGAQNFESGQGAVVVAQSIAPSSNVDRGTVVRIELRHLDSND